MAGAAMVVRALLATGLGALLAGCSGAERIERENNLLREEKAALEAEVARLQDQNRQLAARLEEALAAPAEVAPEVVANIPHLARVSIGRLSHADDSDGDGRPDLLRIYVDPEDDRGRFVQIVGELSVHAAVLPAGADAVTIGRVTLSPGEVREAYRSLLGTHYTVTVPVDLGELSAPGECSVRVIFRDGRSGLEYRAEREIKL